jgi:predicted nucleic-acid-binding protein
MKIVDTNYLVRLFTGAPTHLAQQAVADLHDSSPGNVRLPDYVISELLYVLQFHEQFDYTIHEIAEGVRTILSHAAWQCDRELHEAALRIYTSAKLDYVDCLIVAEAKLGRARTVLSFDKRLLKQL